MQCDETEVLFDKKYKRGKVPFRQINMRIHHTGIIVKSIEKNIAIYKQLGYSLVTDVIDDLIQFNKIILLKSPDKLQILELIEPIGRKSSVYNFKSGYHHICFIADTGENIIESFRRMKIGKIFTKPMPAPALGNHEVVFACLRNGTFVELILQ